nr:myotubularin-related protein 10 [Ciona intestinalis]|eukprot:XP_009861278.1 myotubularin-related protein 10 [Ciona intestinalis]
MAESGFKSYVDIAEKEHKRNEKLTEAYKKVYKQPQQELEGHLLPGEIAIAHSKKVIKYSAHDDPSKGISGTLVCTNFRVTFITTEKPKYDLVEINNSLLAPQDILLNNVEHVYVEYRNKRKKLTPGSKVKDGIERLELHCKDFRIVAFNFKLTIKGEEKTIIKAILHHAYPANVTLLFAFDFQHNQDVNAIISTPLYRNHRDWMESLKRCNNDQSWRVSSINENFTVSPTMGAYMVVPKSLTDNDLSNIVHQYMNDRIPQWCWSFVNGCSIVRSSELRSESEVGGQMEVKFHAAIQSTGSESRNIRVIDLSKQCPNPIQIQQSFIKLRNLCMPASESEYWESDGHWFSLVHNSKWLHHVNTMLSVANDVCMWMNVKEHHVVVKEQTGVDLTPIITSLTQILLDPEPRTIHGFQSLVQREWVIGGHPFKTRLGHLHQPTGNADEATEMSPIFQLFLDCVWQLCRQHPDKFEFNPTYLVVMMDALRLTAFDTFIFNNERERQRRIDQSEQKAQDKSWQSLPLWAWGVQYKQQDLKLFNNPLYKLQESDFFGVKTSDLSTNTTTSKITCLTSSMTSLNGIVENPTNHGASINRSLSSSVATSDSDETAIAQSATQSDGGEIEDNFQIHYNSRTGVVVMGSETPVGDKKKKKSFSIRRKKAKDLSHSQEEEGEVVVCVMPLQGVREHGVKLQRNKDPILEVKLGLPNINMWGTCYHRWLPWSQLFGGSPSAVYRQESMLYDEIHSLHHKIIKLMQSIDDCDIISPHSDDSGMYFPHTPPATPPTHPYIISNYFPYSPVQDLGRKSILGTPLFNFIHGNPIFDFGQKVKNKHSRSPSNFSFTTPSSDEGNSSKSNEKSSATNSLSNSCENLDKPSKKKPLMPPTEKRTPLMPPTERRTPLMPPSESITYISSV